MSFHLAAFFGPITTSGVRQFLPPVTDLYLPSTTNGFLLPTPLRVVAAYATSPSVTASGTSSTSTGAPNVVNGLQNARINAPSLLRVAYPYIRPISNNLGENSDPNVMNLVHRPLGLPASEAVGVEVVSGLVNQVPTTPPNAAALLWFCEHLMPVPPGEHYTLRFAGTSPPTVQGVWSPVGTVTFDQSLPAGNYMVIGFEHWSQNAIAARLLFPGMHNRPGTLSMAGPAPGTTVAFQSSKRGERLFFEGGIGVFGMFNSFAPPSLEVLGFLSGDTQHEAYLTVIRIGDINTHLQNQGAQAPGAAAGPGGYPMGANPSGANPMGANPMGPHHMGGHPMGPHHMGGHHHMGPHHMGAHHAGPLTAATPPTPGTGTPHTF